MKIESKAKVVGTVEFPEFTGERVYMLPFYQADGLPAELSRWQKTVDAMLAGVNTDKPIYLMIDQGVVGAGSTHRRAGLHVDGNWVAGPEEGPGHRHPEPEPGPQPEPDPAPAHRHPGQPRHSHQKYDPETLILASDVSASRAFLGEFDGVPKSDGDCGHIDVQSGKAITLEAGKVYRGNVTLVHESIPVPATCQRTLVRLNIPGLELV